jgi:hypothetical protein
VTAQPTSRQDEHRQLAHVKDDLLREFAALPPAVVDEQISLVVRGFTQAPVRSFIPVLVRRRVRDRLRSLR